MVKPCKWPRVKHTPIGQSGCSPASRCGSQDFDFIGQVWRSAHDRKTGEVVHFSRVTNLRREGFILSKRAELESLTNLRMVPLLARKVKLL
eukprot:4619194-Amphidinium_carterae.1